MPLGGLAFGSRVPFRLTGGRPGADHLSMRYDVAIFGDFQFTGRGRSRAWRRLDADSRAFRSIARVFAKKRHLPPAPVGDVLAELPRVGGHGLFRVEEEGRGVHVCGLLTNTAFDERCRQLAALFMVAA